MGRWQDADVEAVGWLLIRFSVLGRESGCHRHAVMSCGRGDSVCFAAQEGDQS